MSRGHFLRPRRPYPSHPVPEAIGPLAHLFLPVFAVPAASAGSPVVAAGHPEEAILRP
ncbi:hypothetical protein STRTUCAR8_07072 [Streptomyces turgidiscabies Car8]|uniref:Uncharacterized protein n=1 Tax=Streptomyces turgidiscabies (strain Car8) TaxID=698760 RepID=L7F065_STRT8|nr:hypothetical protein STRTUCAR8_07072 [Streptomyces turgidiscabies Car8]